MANEWPSCSGCDKNEKELKEIRAQLSAETAARVKAERWLKTAQESFDSVHADSMRRADNSEAELAAYKRAVPGDKETKEALDWCDSTLPRDLEDSCKSDIHVITLARALRAAWKELEEVKRERDDIKRAESAEKALEKEHENFLLVHRDNMAMSSRNVELSKALAVAVEALEEVKKYTVSDSAVTRTANAALASMRGNRVEGKP